MPINSAHLGVEEGVTVGWCWKSHPDFGYRDEMKSRLKLIMGKAHEDICILCFPIISDTSAKRMGQSSAQQE
jgi:hypothetical protein